MSDTVETLTHPWFPLSAMRRRRVTVRVALDGGSTQVLAHVAPHHGRDMWLERRDGLDDVALPLAVHGSPRTLDGRSIDAWQPRIGLVWPDPLPEPIIAAITRERPPPPEPEPLDGHVHDDGWPYPDLALGCAPDLPRSVRECEARVLRGIRTERHPGVVTGTRPMGFVDSVVAVARGQLVDDYKDKTAIGAEVAPFQPLRRDLTDWDFALRWFARLDRAGQALILARAENPPRTYRAIGKAFSISGALARQRYVDACAVMFRSARRG